MEQTQKTTQVLSYRLSDFLKYKDDYTDAPQNLIPYFYNGKRFENPSIRPYIDQLEAVNALSSGDSEEKSKLFIRTIKFCLNTMNKKNYDKCTEQLGSLDYSNEANVSILVHELILCGMRCPMAVKGLQNIRDGDSPVCILCADMINHLAKIKQGILAGILGACKKFLMDFVNLSNAMDENNENTVDNYKGFMTLVGLIYTRGVIPGCIVLEFVDLVKRTIFNSKQDNTSNEIKSQTKVHHELMFGYKKAYSTDLYDNIVYYDTVLPNDSSEDNRLLCYRKPIECTNFYKGYEYLMNGVAVGLKKNGESSEQFAKAHMEFAELNKRFRIQTKTKNTNPLTPYIMTLHNDIARSFV